ncbi:MAG: hypothetical protein IPG32_09995 [Saprospirales bacterium]|nr:hypothetical protein [Saprospirales bacterium]
MEYPLFGCGLTHPEMQVLIRAGPFRRSQYLVGHTWVVWGFVFQIHILDHPDTARKFQNP